MMVLRRIPSVLVLAGASLGLSHCLPMQPLEVPSPDAFMEVPSPDASMEVGPLFDPPPMDPVDRCTTPVRVDFDVDRDNCGACGVRCGVDQTCRGGSCRTCPAGSVACNNTCLDVTHDRQRCGECTTRCAENETCENGSCTVCPSAQTRVGNRCVDLANDTENCGALALRCPEGARCVAGQCECASGLTACDGSRSCTVNLVDNPAHCGSCSNRCAEGARCVGGICEATQLTLWRPLSMFATYSARPWFRWTMGPGQRRARVEVSNSRLFEVIEHSWEVSGNRFRPDVPLTSGIHFWRVSALNNDGTVAVRSIVWEFAITDNVSERGRALSDVNGDGIVGDPGGDIGWVGDANGDGYGDFMIWVITTRPREPGETLTRHSSRLDLCHGAPTGVPECTVFGSGWSGFYGAYRWYSVYPLGDPDGDGQTDFLLKDVGSNWDSAEWFRYDGGTRQWFRMEDHTEVPILFADLNGDGYDEYIRAANTAVSYSRAVFPTLDPVWLATASDAARQCTLADGSQINASLVTAVDDVNDDGYDDLIVGLSPLRHAILGGPDLTSSRRCIALDR
jgi:hypothetical protein